MATQALWWPPTKIVGRYLAPYLFSQDELEAVDLSKESPVPVEVALDREAPAAKP